MKLRGWAAEVFGVGGFFDALGDFSFLLESSPEGSEGGFGLVEGLGVGVGDVDGAVGGDLRWPPAAW